DPGDDREIDALVREVLASDASDIEQQVALRGDSRHVARLLRGAPTPSSTTEPARDRPYVLYADAPFVLDRLIPRQMPRPRPGPGDVLIEVAAAGLNFRDVLMALGALPGLEGGVALGGECAGTVLEVGEGVTHLRPGQRVLAMTTGAFATHAVARAAHVVPLPSGLSPEQAAGIPVVFATAWYALHDLARLRSGERVLIHAAAGGTGQAAIKLARRIGSAILATAGSDEKRAWLRDQGIEHVMDSRSLRFADEVLEATGGRGVDVVLNSLSGPAIEAGLRCLAEGGRFIELGTRDIYEDRALSLSSFRKGLSFSAVDLAGMLHRGHPRVGELLHEVAQAFERREIEPVETHVFPMSQAARVFADMASARHRGKLVLSIGDPETPILAAPRRAEPRADGTYLVTGGLGGLGLAAARWLAERGAGHLLLVGRRGAQTDAQRAAVEALRQLGAEVTVAAADVADRADLEQILARHVSEDRPLRGVFHAAGVLADATLEHQDLARFETVLRPKAAGAQHLHALTAGAPLDYFVLYSSAASLLGAPGQANYAAANAFLDALAHRRRAEGLAGLSINWGAFSGVGLAADRTEALEHRGLGSMTVEEGNALLSRLLEQSPPQVGALKLRLRQWLSFHPAIASASWLSELAESATEPGGTGDAALLSALHKAPPAQRRRILAEWIRGQVAAVLRRPPSDVDPGAPLSEQGLDSLMGIELRNRMETALKLTLSATLVWAHPTVERLAEHLDHLVSPQPSPEAEQPVSTSLEATVAAEVAALSDEEVARRLAEALLD
ncbi:MAG: SDR family NAD(P)-dependent oxidoreductase, partial [Polyangiaceae bacterium]|nr:SDR family NAD(P)-dependent oxidoreductase [Polyangiaceae bacterium]